MNSDNVRKARPRSFFTRKLEGKLDEKEERMPQTFLSLLDLPFDDFTPEEHETYEKQLKPLFHTLSAVLLEIFDQMGRPEEGWEESTKLLPDCPVKVVAMLALYEFRNSQNGHGDALGTPDDYTQSQPAQAPQPAQAASIFSHDPHHEPHATSRGAHENARQEARGSSRRSESGQMVGQEDLLASFGR